MVPNGEGNRGSIPFQRYDSGYQSRDTELATHHTEGPRYRGENSSDSGGVANNHPPSAGISRCLADTEEGLENH